MSVINSNLLETATRAGGRLLRQCGELRFVLRSQLGRLAGGISQQSLKHGGSKGGECTIDTDDMDVML